MPFYALAFLVGVVQFQQLHDMPGLEWLWLIPLAVVATLAWRPVRWVLAGIFGFCWAMVYAHWLLYPAFPVELEGIDLVAHGYVVEVPRVDGQSARFQFVIEDLQVDGVPVPWRGAVMLTWRNHDAKLWSGERWQLALRLKRPWGYLNPGGFDYESRLFALGVRASGYVQEGRRAVDASGRSANVRLDEASGWGVDYWRQKVALAIDHALVASTHGGMITALAVGEQRGITDDQWDQLRRTGTSHLMAISGLHVGLVAGFAFFLGRWLWSRLFSLALWMPAPKAGAWAGLAAALFYAAMAGFSVPTQRALVMVAIALGAVLLMRQIWLSQLLAVALLAVLIIDPLAVLSAGFWLSFGAVAVIGYGMSGRLGRQGWWWQWGRAQWLVGIGLVPLTLLFFHSASLISPVANMLAVPWVSFITVPLTLAGAAVVLWWPWCGELLLGLAEQSLALLWIAVRWFGEFDHALWTQTPPAPAALACAVAGVFLLLAPRGLPGRYLGVIGLLPLLFPRIAVPAANEAWFTLLDVGQGLAAVVRTAEHVLVYDTGPRQGESFDTGAAVVAPYLRHMGIHHIDVLVVSHGDIDHSGGVSSLAREINIRRVISSVPDQLDGVNAEHCVRGQSWDWSGVAFRILHPPAPSYAESENNRSCVLSVVSGNHRLLLTGDIESSAERYLLRHTPDDLSADILVVPHHGSKTSSSPDFVQAVAPRYALFPVGYRNRFRFPRSDVTARYENIGAHLMNSSDHGAITFLMPGAGLLAPPESYRQQAARYWNSRP